MSGVYVELNRPTPHGMLHQRIEFPAGTDPFAVLERAIAAVQASVGGPVSAPAPRAPGFGVRDISRDAYARVRASGKVTKQQSVIGDWLQNLKGADATRSEISEGTGIKLSSVTGRVFELIEGGFMREVRQRTCRATGETAWALVLL